MKKNIIWAVLILLAVGCQKDQSGFEIPIYTPGPQDTGWGNAKRDGQKWEATTFATKHQDKPDYLGIYFWTSSEEGFNREVLLLNEIPILLGKYQIKGRLNETYDGFVGATYGIAQDDGDVAGPTYDPVDGETGTLELTKIDTINNIVAGKFDRIAFKNRNENSFFPQTVVFENGHFEMEIVQ